MEHGDAADATQRSRHVLQGRPLARQEDQEVLLDLLQQRFGPVPEEAAGKVAAASSQQLRAWIRRVLTATALDEVLVD
jgi:hypothetical protein